MVPGADVTGVVFSSVQLARWCQSELACYLPRSPVTRLPSLTSLTSLAAVSVLGSLPEQVNSAGQAASVAPLAWTDAVTLLALLAQAGSLPTVPVPAPR